MTISDIPFDPCEEANFTSIVHHYAGAETLKIIQESYVHYHGYLAVIVCTLGILANIVNFIVLTRKHMISSTNYILTGLAVSDGLTMLAYLPFAIIFNCIYGTTPSAQRNSLGMITFLAVYASFSVVVHTISIWLTVLLAVLRYIFIGFPHRGAELCSLPRAKLATLLVCVGSIVTSVPNFIATGIREVKGCNQTWEEWTFGFKSETDGDNLATAINFWTQAIVVRLVPCVGLTVLSILLINAMKAAEKRRDTLKRGGGSSKPGGGSSKSGVPPQESSKNPKNSSPSDRKGNKTTLMLLTVVILFLITEFPQGILSLLSEFLPDFIYQVYVPLGDILDMSALLNNGINFILYCTMSKQFRDTFLEIFCPTCLRKRYGFNAVSQNSTRSSTARKT